MENNTAKHFVLQLGSLASLYLSLSFLVMMLFGVINISMPDAADATWQISNAKEGIKVGFAMVVVFFPTYLVLTRIVNKNRRASASHSYLTLTKWLIYLSLLIGGAVLLGDLVAVIMAYLDGDITNRFIFKAFSLLLIVGSAFTYYLLDAKGYWLTHEAGSKFSGAAALVVVLLVLGLGFSNIDTPTEARELKLDEQQVSDLQEIQWLIQDYLVTNGELPADLESLNAVSLPEAPQEREAYQYSLSEKGFTLCATFARETTADDLYIQRIPVEIETPAITNPSNWEHKAGHFCYERVVK